MSFSKVNISVGITTSGGSVTISPTTTKGNLIVVAVGNPDTRTLLSVTDDKGNTYTVDKTTSVSGCGSGIASCVDAFGGVSSVTVTLSGSSTSNHVDVIEFLGNLNKNFVGTSSSTTGTGTAIAVTAFNPTVGNLIVAAMGASGNRAMGAGANYTKASTDVGNIYAMSEYRLVCTSTETAPMTSDASVTWAEVAVEYNIKNILFNNYQFPSSVSAGIISVTEKIR